MRVQEQVINSAAKYNPFHNTCQHLPINYIKYFPVKHVKARQLGFNGSYQAGNYGYGLVK